MKLLFLSAYRTEQIYININVTVHTERDNMKGEHSTRKYRSLISLYFSHLMIIISTTQDIAFYKYLANKALIKWHLSFCDKIQLNKRCKISSRQEIL